MLYLVIYILLFISGFVEIFTQSRTIKLGLGCLIFLLFVAISGFRWETGTDWIPYYLFFTENSILEDFTNNFLMETGFGIYNYWVKRFSESYTVLLLISASITIGLKTFFLWRYLHFFLIGLLLYFAFFIADIFSVRQTLASSITLLGTVFIIQRKPGLFILCVLIATAIHVTSIVFLGAYYVAHRHISTKCIIVLLAGAIALGVTSSLSVVFKIISSQLSDTLIGVKLEYYLTETDINNTGLSTTFILFTGYTRRLIMIPIYLIFRDKVSQSNPKFNIYFNLFLVGNLLFFISGSAGMVFARFTIFFLFYEILLIVMILENLITQQRRIWTYMLTILYGGMKLYLALSAYWDLYIPYYSIFDSYIPRSSY
jgi:EpsG family